MADDLQLQVKRPLREIPESEWGWPSEAAAIGSMIAMSGLQEKAIAIETGLDPSTLAKVKNGTARPSEDCNAALMDACGSEAWLFYWVLKRGYDPRSLRKLETDTERRLREATEALERERLKVSLLTEALQGRAANG